jgi:hypothetical protein
LPYYLGTHKATSNQTYAQYLSGFKSGEVFKDDSFTTQSVGSMDAKQVAVIFYYIKGRTFVERFQKNTLGNTAAMGAGATIACAGLIITGVVTGVFTGGATTIALGTVASAACGVTGIVASKTIGSPDASYMGVVVVRPLTTENIKSLGCQYSPAVNQLN